MKDHLRLIYMAGGADYTIVPLKKILESQHKLVQVYTKHPKPKGRGKKVLLNSLQKFLDKNNLAYSMPDNYKALEEIRKIKELKPDVIIVFSYGQILPQAILDVPKIGSLNIHASLLPKWRGPSPVQYALLNNEKKTGFSLMEMNLKMDEGKILYKETLNIDKSDNTDTLLKKITNLASEAILKVLKEYAEGSIIGEEQDHKLASYSHIIKKSETYLDFNDEADNIIGKIRAYNPNPGAKCFINGELIKIIEAKKEFVNRKEKKPGTVIDNRLLIACRVDAIRPIIIQRSGKKALNITEILNGWKIAPGTLVKSSIK